MTAPTDVAPASSTGGADNAGQALADTSTSPAGPGAAGSTPTDTGAAAGAGDDAGASQHDGRGDGPRGRRAPGEHVRSASRDDDAPQDPAGDDAGGKAGKPGEWKVEDLPAGAQKLIGDLRKEAGTRRAEAAEAKKGREAAEAKAADGDDRFAKATHAFMSALGLTPEPDEPERAPEELLAEATTNYRNTRVELAVFRAASAHGGDPEALLDSRAFLSRAHALDPSADDFDSSIAAAIAEAVQSNPKLRAEQPVAARLAPSGGDFGGGPAEPPGPEEWSVDDFRRARLNGRG